ncbi:MAG: 23S rRNA (pseudouridine(1915)-N(3))-methyltransferase RlmH [Firmicutes bacterium]|nr:23S rRNA (pseudouridine(1915)-N(3))-methyltransferase RlmH [Bacillota bacterium]
MRFQIVAVGKLRGGWLKQGCTDFQKRLSRHAGLSIVEVPDLPWAASQSAAEARRVIEAEGEKLLARINPRSYVIALDPAGKAFSSEKLASFFQHRAVQGMGYFTFVIGGSLGLSKAVLSRADLVLSFSEFTFPHQLMRLILLEQLYRSCKIIAGETYHK